MGDHREPQEEEPATERRAEAANPKRNVTIMAVIIAGVFALAGIIGTGVVAYAVTSHQTQTESERAAAELLRNQRQASYTVFYNQAVVTWQKLSAVTGLFQPGNTPPNLGQFDAAYGDFLDNKSKLSGAAFDLSFNATERVQKAVNGILYNFQVLDDRLKAATTFFQGKPFDDFTKTVPLTPADTGWNDNLVNAFTCATHADLGVPNPKPGAPNACS